MTSVYVTHDQVEAVALADRIAVMRAGRIEQVGTYHELYHNPVNLFVGSFVGTPLLNTFQGETRDGQWHGTNFGRFPIRPDLADETRVIMGIRPEYIRLSDEGVAAVVEHVTPYFSERYQVLDVFQDREDWQLIVPLDTPIEVGATIHCQCDPEHVLFFDARNGTRNRLSEFRDSRNCSRTGGALQQYTADFVIIDCLSLSF